MIVPKENHDGLKELVIRDMPDVMGALVMSALTDSNIHSLTYLILSNNASWWKDNTLFNQLLPFLSQQKHLKKF